MRGENGINNVTFTLDGPFSLAALVRVNGILVPPLEGQKTAFTQEFKHIN